MYDKWCTEKKYNDSTNTSLKTNVKRFYASISKFSALLFLKKEKKSPSEMYGGIFLPSLVRKLIYVDLSDLYVDLSDHYDDLSENIITTSS